MTLSRLIELAIVTDLSNWSQLSQFLIQIHDNPGSKDGDQQYGGQPQPFVITVTAQDTGPAIYGTLIKNISVQVELRSNIAADQTSGALLDSAERLVSDRLQADYVVTDAFGVQHNRLAEFSGPTHQVVGIIPGPVTRSESNLERIRVVNRTFKAQLLS